MVAEMGVGACCGGGVGGVKVVRDLLIFEEECGRVIYEKQDEAAGLKAKQEL